MITLTSYEEVVRAAPNSEPIGRVSGRPGGRGTPLYNSVGLEKIVPELRDTIMTSTPSEIDGRSVVRIVDNRRLLVDGATLDPVLAGREFVRLSSAALSRRDLQLRGEWRDMAVWIFEMDEGGRLQVPHNVGLLGGELGATPSRLSMIWNRVNALTVYQPFASESFEKCSYYLKSSPYYGFASESKDRWTQVSADDMKELDGRFLPGVRVVRGCGTVGPTTASTLEVEVFDPSTGEALRDPPLTLEITALSGYVPKSKVPVKNGRAEFRVIGLGLEIGETVELRVGLGHSTRLLELSLIVTDAAT